MQRGARQDAADITKSLADVHPASVDDVLADILGVCRPAHLEDRDAPVHLPKHLHIAKQNDRVVNRGIVMSV